MGGKQSCPSDALDQVWVQDKDAPHCFNCGTDFTMRRRRHHCRCCGGIFCVACWGEQAQLEEAYGFATAVPICSICGEVYRRDGSMYLLRKGVTVAQTHEPRSNVTAESQIPPLANANIRARKFRTNLLTLNHWRPFTKRTKIQLTKTKSSKEVLRAAKSAGLTPRGESNLSGRDSASGVSSSNNRDSIVVAGSNDDFWTIELDSIESIQLLSFDEKQGGEFICVTTNMDEHRIQAVKVRFEEVAAMLPNVVNKLMSNNDNNNNMNDYAGEDPTPSSARGVPIPMNNNNNRNNSNDEYSGASVSRGSVIRNGRLADRTNGLGSSSYRSSSSGMLMPNSNSNINANNNNSNNGNDNDNDDEDTNNNGGNDGGNNGNALTESPGGEKCSASASDRRSNVSANGARLRTVMLDQEATRNLYNALLRAHYVCRKRAEFVPAGVKFAVEVDFAESEVHIGPGAGSVTPRMATTRQSSPAGFGYSAQSHIGNNNNNNNENNNNGNNNSSANFNVNNNNNNGANTGRTQRTRAYTMA